MQQGEGYLRPLKSRALRECSWRVAGWGPWLLPPQYCRVGREAQSVESYSDVKVNFFFTCTAVIKDPLLKELYLFAVRCAAE